MVTVRAVSVGRCGAAGRGEGGAAERAAGRGGCPPQRRGAPPHHPRVCAGRVLSAARRSGERARLAPVPGVLRNNVPWLLRNQKSVEPRGPAPVFCSEVLRLRHLVKQLRHAWHDHRHTQLSSDFSPLVDLVGDCVLQQQLSMTAYGTVARQESQQIVVRYSSNGLLGITLHVHFPGIRY